MKLGLELLPKPRMDELLMEQAGRKLDRGRLLNSFVALAAGSARNVDRWRRSKAQP